MKQSEGSPEMETPLLLPTDVEDVDAEVNPDADDSAVHHFVRDNG